MSDPRKVTLKLSIALLLGLPLASMAQQDSGGGIMTRCYGESNNVRWAILDGDFSYEACKARVIDCTKNPNATVHYENLGQVLVPYPVRTCRQGIPVSFRDSLPKN